MGENIYVGNRYVPKYMGEWSSAAQYESLSAVLYQGNAYVSNKPVPAGTLPTDTDYWAFWGSGNAAIDSLTVRVTTLETLAADLNNRVGRAETSIDNLSTRMGLAEGNIDALFAEQGSQSRLIGQIQSEISVIQNTISSIQTDLQNYERTNNKNAANGYMGLTSGYADRPTLLASPLIMTANITAAQTVTTGTQNVRFNNVLHQTMVGITEAININYSGTGQGTFTITGPTQYYDVWISGAVLCIPSGNTGIKDIYVQYNNEARFATEAYFPNGATRISIQIPEVYLGPVASGSGQFGIAVTNWTSGDVIGQGSIPNDNYGSTWVSIKAYRRYLPVG